MKDKNLDELKKKYLETPIPSQLDFVVKKALQESRAAAAKKKRFNRARIAAASIAAALVILIVGVNTSPAFAQTLSKVPVVGSIVRVITLREYKVNEGQYMADIKVPEIQGMENKTLENSLNEKYLAENKELYEQFMAEMKAMEEKGGGHKGVSSSYEVKTDNDTIFSVCRSILTIEGSSNTELKYDTIDKKKQVLISLPSLFKDDSYVDVISNNIISQMREEMKSDEGKIYWLDDQVEDVPIEPFEQISKDQNFYINTEGKLVISFNKYDIAPGCMGTPEFVIPTEVISDLLVGDEYVR